jgi:hypothetical protein
MLSIVILNVITLSVMAPLYYINKTPNVVGIMLQDFLRP